MDADETRSQLNAISERIIGCTYKVSNTLGHGFLEKVYENALAHDLRKGGAKVQAQHPISVYYDGTKVGDFAADLLVESSVLVELKAVKELDDAHEAQCINYLRATGLRLCLLINFGQARVQIRRIVNKF